MGLAHTVLIEYAIHRMHTLANEAYGYLMACLINGLSMKYRKSLSSALISLFCGVLTLFVLLDRLPIIVPVGYGALSLFAVLIYGIDKSAAKKDMWRISEAKLHLLSLVGGWPGALLAQQIFKHKRNKSSFMKVYWVMVVVNLFLLGLIAFEVINTQAFKMEI
ncbi:hypothetical protein KUL156_15780 [Alteromonas sp. KUL156]|nr:hypothetical protein KUL154_31060 [Alteromonas sp. KUL154]GFD98985.1 hypothetical protein KUL156_15780 [Alteromonas sp. KUL156]